MQRFYFDLADGVTTIRDDVGVEAVNLDEALEEAEAVIREMRANGELAHLGDGWTLSIRAEAETVLAILLVE
ncbi:hypothetical protein M446_7009 (plasmid) [Methylobacterium sp. 4-46]|uniref:DUF6894 family protein n=1 Tax=unclassified Methylobacterium TaxID=2615210 RepID=UPI000165CC35|nr:MULTISPECIES: hypothetical protein [Methylobacterium]ACA21235.1 hypothetical protein M446_7009 [Methylobacterium sp. 4-46]WFT83797.1 hypothetical protein QA634_35275 [Methylobacterium nodulans]